MFKKLLIISFALISLVVGTVWAAEDGGEVGNGGENQAVMGSGVTTTGQLR